MLLFIILQLCYYYYEPMSAATRRPGLKTDSNLISSARATELNGRVKQSFRKSAASEEEKVINGNAHS